MPVIKSAIKKLRQDKRREVRNDAIRAELKLVLYTAKKSKTSKSIGKAISLVDKAAKNGIIHTNKASRLKSSLSKLAKPASTKTAVKPSSKKSQKITSKKKVK